MAEPELRRYENYYFRAKSPPTDYAQVPVTGATAHPTRQGATTTETVVFNEQETHDIGVQDAGFIEVGDVLFLGLDHEVQLSVLAISSDRKRLTLQNFAGFIAVAAGLRLRPSSNQPVLYKDRKGLNAYGATPPTVDANGVLWFYSPAPLLDFELVGGGLPDVRLYVDVRCGWLRGAETWLNSDDFLSIQAAIDSLPPKGGTVFVPGGVHLLTTTLYTPCDRPCHLIGEGSNLPVGIAGASEGTILRWTTNVGMLRVRGDGSSVRGMTLENTSNGSAASEDTGYGIAIGRRHVMDVHPPPGVTANFEYEMANKQPLRPVSIEDVDILSSPGWGLYIPGFGKQSDGTTPEPNSVTPNATEGGTLSFWVDCKRVRVRSSFKYGACFTGGGCTLCFFENCAFLWVGSGQVPNDNYYTYVSGTVDVVFVRCTFEGWGPVTKEWVKLWAAENVVFDACYFEEDPRSDAGTYIPKPFVFLVQECRGGVIRNCHFVRGFGNNGVLTFIKIDSAGGARGLSIQNPDGISATALLSAPGTYKDTAHIDLGGNGNEDISVFGAGTVTDQSIPTKYPLQYSGVPRISNAFGRLLNKLPGATDAELTGASSPSKALATQNGNLVLNWDLASDSTGVPAAMYFWGGTPGGWRLANNLPTLTTNQRNARTTWVQGDMIYNVTTGRLEIRIGSTWYYVTLTQTT